MSIQVITRRELIPFSFYNNKIFINKFVSVKYGEMESWLNEQGLTPIHGQFHIKCSGFTDEIKMHFLLKFS